MKAVNKGKPLTNEICTLTSTVGVADVGKSPYIADTDHVTKDSQAKFTPVAPGFPGG